MTNQEHIKILQDTIYFMEKNLKSWEDSVREKVAENISLRKEIRLLEDENKRLLKKIK